MPYQLQCYAYLLSYISLGMGRHIEGSLQEELEQELASPWTPKLSQWVENWIQIEDTKMSDCNQTMILIF